eukprot:6764344-Ditylum_brightwellii.AAC.1
MAEKKAIDNLRSIVEFFGYPEQRVKLEQYTIDNSFKYYMPKLAGDTRILSCHTITQQMLFSF